MDLYGTLLMLAFSAWAYRRGKRSGSRAGYAAGRRHRAKTKHSFSPELPCGVAPGAFLLLSEVDLRAISELPISVSASSRNLPVQLSENASGAPQFAIADHV